MNIKYFGQIAEVTHCNEEIIEANTLEKVLEIVGKKYNLDAKNFKIALNKKIIETNCHLPLAENDEIALLPPYSGG